MALLIGLLVGCGGGVAPVQSGGDVSRIGQVAPENRKNQINDDMAPLRVKQIWERLTTNGLFSYRWQLSVTEDRLFLELGCEKGAVSDFLIGSASIQIEKDTIFVGEDIRLDSKHVAFANNCSLYLPAGIYEYDVSMSELVLHSTPADLVFYRQ
jgi:hypothetical protein